MNALLYIIELNKFLRSFQNTCQIICSNRRKNCLFNSDHVKSKNHTHQHSAIL